MIYKHLMLLPFLAITVLLFLFFDADWEVWLSFAISALIITSITIYHLYIERVYSPFLSAFIVFTFLFFLVAPIVQITSFTGINSKFMQNFPYDEGLVMYTNFLICLFNVIFFGAYLVFKNSHNALRPKVSSNVFDFLPSTILILAVLTGIIFISSFDYVIDEIERPAWLKSDVSISLTLIWKKVLFLVPFGGIILIFQYYKKGNKKVTNLLILTVLLIFFAVIFFWFKNPLTEKRNALGPAYLCLVFMIIPKLLNTNLRTLLTLFLIMIIGFPLSAILTHTDASFNQIKENPLIIFDEIKGGGITTVFNTLNYDAFANIMATIDYVSRHGFSFGEQLSGALLFFIPRSLWEDKPISTGIYIGDYLIERYDFIFNNLSNPFMSEGYINFGILGIILFAIALAYTFIKLISWLKSQDLLYRVMAFYFAIHLLFLLRGDFTNGFSYYIGTLLGVIAIPKIINWLIRNTLKKNDSYG